MTSEVMIPGLSTVACKLCDWSAVGNLPLLHEHLTRVHGMPTGIDINVTLRIEATASAADSPCEREQTSGGGSEGEERPLIETTAPSTPLEPPSGLARVATSGGAAQILREEQAYQDGWKEAKADSTEGADRGPNDCGNCGHWFKEHGTNGCLRGDGVTRCPCSLDKEGARLTTGAASPDKEAAPRTCGNPACEKDPENCAVTHLRGIRESLANDATEESPFTLAERDWWAYALGFKAGQTSVGAGDTDLNTALHALLGFDEPCQNACTHVFRGGESPFKGWTALGIANVLKGAATS